MYAYVSLSPEYECVVKIYASGHKNFLTSKNASKTRKIGIFLVFNSSKTAKPKRMSQRSASIANESSTQIKGTISFLARVLTCPKNPRYVTAAADIYWPEIQSTK